jgi:flagellar motility protein MotE (MotC chaperone)
LAGSAWSPPAASAAPPSASQHRAMPSVTFITAPAQDFVAKEPAKTGYCANIADAAADARFAWQKEQLAVMERQVEERIKLLEEKRAEYEAWLKRRNEFLAKADESVVAVYAKARPAARAASISERMALAVRALSLVSRAAAASSGMLASWSAAASGRILA